MPLRERDRPLAMLSAAVGRAGRGSGSVVAVFGEAGIGKTSLLDELARPTEESAKTNGELLIAEPVRDHGRERRCRGDVHAGLQRRNVQRDGNAADRDVDGERDVHESGAAVPGAGGAAVILPSATALAQP